MTPPGGKRHQRAAVIRSTDLGFPPEVAESGLELLHDDAFRKGTTQTASPSPALAIANSRFSPRSDRRPPSLVHGPPPSLLGSQRRLQGVDRRRGVVIVVAAVTGQGSPPIPRAPPSNHRPPPGSGEQGHTEAQIERDKVKEMKLAQVNPDLAAGRWITAAMRSHHQVLASHAPARRAAPGVVVDQRRRDRCTGHRHGGRTSITKAARGRSRHRWPPAGDGVMYLG